jgi:two-component system response regulator HydG
MTIDAHALPLHPSFVNYGESATMFAMSPASASVPNHLAAWTNPAPEPDSRDTELFSGVGHSMRHLAAMVRRVAAMSSTVLLSGETGTGKTRMARLIHDLSPRRGQPFLVVNCGALSASLIESEMFGHIKGAFTGADRDRVGKFADAGGGTLFLDEIDSLPPSLQAKLLRAVEDRVFEAVGSNKTMEMQARLIVASNRDLAREVARGHFRDDLYYRLNVVGFTLPPLRERPEVIAGLANRFLEQFADQCGRRLRGFSAAAMYCLETHSWPGNIRELRNVIERAVVLGAGDLVGTEDLPASTRGDRPPEIETRVNPLFEQTSAPTNQTLVATREEAEQERILEALAKNGNNRRRASRDLGISRMTLYKKMHKYGLMGNATD